MSDGIQAKKLVHGAFHFLWLQIIGQITLLEAKSALFGMGLYWKLTGGTTTNVIWLTLDLRSRGRHDNITDSFVFPLSAALLGQL